MSCSQFSTQIDFSRLPIEALYRYLVQFDLVPEIDPSPLGPDDPAPPASLLRGRGHAPRLASTASPAPSLHVTPANRPRRDGTSRRRSTRLVEDDHGLEMVALPVLADVEDVHRVLATVAQRHFREHVVPEVDTLASFMCAAKAKGEFYQFSVSSIFAPVRRLLRWSRGVNQALMTVRCMSISSHFIIFATFATMQVLTSCF